VKIGDAVVDLHKHSIALWFDGWLQDAARPLTSIIFCLIITRAFRVDGAAALCGQKC